VLVCQQGFQFFPDKAAAAREARRVLAPGGRALLSCWRALEVQGLFPVVMDAAQEHVGGDAVAMFRGAFNFDVEDARTVLRDAGFRSVRVGTRVSSARFARVDSPAQMIALLLTAAPPVLAAINGAPGAARGAVEAAVGAAMEAMRDDDGVVFPVQTHLLTAQA
jgi:SAM-dependent methyltransferase